MNNSRWKAHLAIEYKLEAGGRGHDDTTPGGLDVSIQQWLKHCPPDKYPCVFDPGAGAGCSVKLLRDLGYIATGYTLGADNIQMAKEKYGVSLLEHDFHTPAFNDNSFDGIFSVQTVEHAISNHIMFIEFWRILRPGGVWMLDTPDSSADSMWTMQWHHNLHSKRSWLKLAEGYGFRVEADESHGDRVTLFLEKLPADKHPNWSYFKWVYQQLAQCTNSE